MSFEHVKAWKNGETRRFCAETIASLLITQVLPPSDTAWRQETWAEKMAGKREHVAQLVDEIFRILSESDHWLAAAPADDDEDLTRWPMKTNRCWAIGWNRRRRRSEHDH